MTETMLLTNLSLQKSPRSQMRNSLRKYLRGFGVTVVLADRGLLTLDILIKTSRLLSISSLRKRRKPIKSQTKRLPRSVFVAIGAMAMYAKKSSQLLDILMTKYSLL